MSGIIKTTARYHEPAELHKQRPLIQVDGLRNPLPNTIRASLDSGRDNPFRPDGPIYKSADPIVDYYKNAANLSRPVSPTDSQLLLGLKPGKSDTQKTDQEDAKSDLLNKTEERHSCWRKWLCCGFCRCKRSRTNRNNLAPSQKSMTKDGSDEHFQEKLSFNAKSAPVLDENLRASLDTELTASLRESSQIGDGSTKLSSNSSKLQHIAAFNAASEELPTDRKRPSYGPPEDIKKNEEPATGSGKGGCVIL